MQHSREMAERRLNWSPFPQKKVKSRAWDYSGNLKNERGVFLEDGSATCKKRGRKLAAKGGNTSTMFARLREHRPSVNTVPPCTPSLREHRPSVTTVPPWTPSLRDHRPSVTTVPPCTPSLREHRPSVNTVPPCTPSLREPSLHPSLREHRPSVNTVPPCTPSLREHRPSVTTVPPWTPSLRADQSMCPLCNFNCLRTNVWTFKRRP